MKRTILTLITLSTCILMFALSFEGIKVSVWDNDGDLTFFSAPDNKLIGYEPKIIEALNSIGINHDSGNLTVSSSMPDFSKYSAVFIVCGHRHAEEILLNDKDVKAIRKYLEKGGCIYLEGNNIMEDLEKAYQEFQHDYFNVQLKSAGEAYSGIGYLETNTEGGITNDIDFSFPAWSEPDISVDELEPYRVCSPEEFSIVLTVTEQSKLYKSAASAYSPPEMKSKQAFRTYIQSTALSAMSSTNPDLIKTSELRNEYIRDILSFFGIGRVILIDDGFSNIYTINDELHRMNIETEIIEIDDSASNGPAYPELRKYKGAFWLSDEKTDFLTENDIANLNEYEFYGGKKYIQTFDNAKTNIEMLAREWNISSSFTPNIVKAPAAGIDIYEKGASILFSVTLKNCTESRIIIESRDNAVNRELYDDAVIEIAKPEMGDCYTVTILNADEVLLHETYKIAASGKFVSFKGREMNISSSTPDCVINIYDICGRINGTFNVKNGMNSIVLTGLRPCTYFAVNNNDNESVKFSIFK